MISIDKLNQNGIRFYDFSGNGNNDVIHSEPAQF